MSEHFDEQLSEFIDDEMSAEECEFFVRRLQRDEAARGRYLRYQLIGAAVRGEHVQHNASGLRDRLAAALADDGALASSPVRAIAGNRLVVGASIAAGFALFAAIGWGIAALDGLPGNGGELASARAEARSMVDMPAQPRDGETFAARPAQVTGIQYLVHHAGYSSGLNRTIMQSGLITAGEDAAEALPEAAAPEAAAID
jgi:hypothetical protein